MTYKARCLVPACLQPFCRMVEARKQARRHGTVGGYDSGSFAIAGVELSCRKAEESKPVVHVAHMERNSFSYSLNPGEVKQVVNVPMR